MSSGVLDRNLSPNWGSHKVEVFEALYQIITFCGSLEIATLCSKVNQCLSDMFNLDCWSSWERHYLFHVEIGISLLQSRYCSIHFAIRGGTSHYRVYIQMTDSLHKLVLCTLKAVSPWCSVLGSPWEYMLCAFSIWDNHGFFQQVASLGQQTYDISVFNDTTYNFAAIGKLGWCSVTFHSN